MLSWCCFPATFGRASFWDLTCTYRLLSQHVLTFNKHAAKTLAMSQWSVWNLKQIVKTQTEAITLIDYLLRRYCKGLIDRDNISFLGNMSSIVAAEPPSYACKIGWNPLKPLKSIQIHWKSWKTIAKSVFQGENPQFCYLNPLTNRAASTLV